MADQKMITARALALRSRFQAAGAQVVEPPILQPADTLLGLYGEDIRARAYVTFDAVRGEQMLRPDFTVPVAQMHMSEGASPARYTYAGEIFRRQDEYPDRPNEYVQVGYEVFDDTNPAEADAEVFALIAREIAPLKLRVATGDIGILMAAVRGLATTERRRAALLRHIWRPRRFRQLLDRFSGRTPMTTSRVALLEHPDPMAETTTPSGKRGHSEIAERLQALREDARTPPLSDDQVGLLEDLLAVRETVPFALERLRDLAVDMPAISTAVEGFAARAAAFSSRGVDVDSLDFEASYGRTALEYYDGFVFGFYAEDRPDLPPVASGGRYDALTERLGQGAVMPAVGGVLRPGLMLDLEAAL